MFLGEVSSSSVIPVISSVTSLSKVASAHLKSSIPPVTPVASLSKALRTNEIRAALIFSCLKAEKKDVKYFRQLC